MSDDGEVFYPAINDPELRGYDGFGAPIYAHQEDDMPTNLPDDFKGIGKPADPIDPLHGSTNPADEKPPRWFYYFMTIVTILGLWTLAHAALAVVHAIFRLTM